MSTTLNQSESCIFCKIIKGEEEGSFLYRGDKVSAFLDIHPLFEGHALVVPNEHFTDIRDVSEVQLFEVIKVARQISKMMIKNLNADGINIMHSTGRPAGQTIFHFHIHVLPRKVGDDITFQQWWFARSHKASRQELNDMVRKITID